MPRRLTIAGLMGIVVVVAAGLAALRYPDRLWASAAFSLAIASVVIAILVATATHGAIRAASRGFAIAAGIYLTLTLGPGFETHIGHDLITTPLNDFAYEKMNTAQRKRIWIVKWDNATGMRSDNFRDFWLTDRALTNGEAPRPMGLSTATGDEKTILSSHARVFFRIGHSLLGLLAGLAGGLLCLSLSRRSDDRNRPQLTTAVSP